MLLEHLMHLGNMDKAAWQEMFLLEPWTPIDAHIHVVHSVMHTRNCGSVSINRSGIAL